MPVTYPILGFPGAGAFLGTSFGGLLSSLHASSLTLPPIHSTKPIRMPRICRFPRGAHPCGETRGSAKIPCGPIAVRGERCGATNGVSPVNLRRIRCPSTPAVERRRHAVPAPHRNRSGERTGQGPLQGGGQHGQRPGCCPEVPSAPRRLAHHQQRQGADGVNAPGPSPNSSPTPVRGPFLHPLEEL